MITAAYLPLAADLDRDFDVELEINDGVFDFAGYSAKMEVRAARSLNAPLLATGTVTLEDGWIRASILKADTAGIEAQRGWYDIAITDPGGKTYNWLMGPFSFDGVATDA